MGERERERYRRDRRVALVDDRFDDRFIRNAEVSSNGIENARVGLVRHEPVDVLRPHSGRSERFLRAGCHHLHGLGEHFAAVGDRHPCLLKAVMEWGVASASGSWCQFAVNIGAVWGACNR